MSDTFELKKRPDVIELDTMRALEFIANTSGKGFDGDVDKVVEWLLVVAKRNEPWLRFTLDLFAESERARAANGHGTSQE